MRRREQGILTFYHLCGEVPGQLSETDREKGFPVSVGTMIKLILMF